MALSRSIQLIRRNGCSESLRRWSRVLPSSLDFSPAESPGRQDGLPLKAQLTRVYIQDSLDDLHVQLSDRGVLAKRTHNQYLRLDAPGKSKRNVFRDTTSAQRTWDHFSCGFKHPNDGRSPWLAVNHGQREMHYAFCVKESPDLQESVAVSEGQQQQTDTCAEVEAAASTSGLAGSAVWAVLAAPIPLIVSSLDAFQASTQAPWWVVLVGSTLMLRCTLLPLTLLQVKKSSELAKLGPQLPPPYPVPGSGKPWGQAWQEYRSRCRQLGAPSLCWLFIAPLVQGPVFIYWVLAVRSMALSGHLGFHSGGALWFQDLASPAQGVVGAALPLLIAGTYLASLQVSFGAAAKAGSATSSPYLLGVHLYWLTNNVFSLAQGLCLKDDRVRALFGIPPISHLLGARESIVTRADQLIVLAAREKAEGRTSEAMGILRRALEVDEKHGPSMIALGQMHADLRQWPLAAAHFLRAISVSEKDAGVLQAAYLGAGLALANQVRLPPSLSAPYLATTAGHLKCCGASDFNHCSGGQMQGSNEEAEEKLRLAAQIKPSADHGAYSEQRHLQALISLSRYGSLRLCICLQ
eukprot:jgi/Mesen1/4445/ME000226S03385